MLSRTADHLYWMARYTERAENMARLLDVTYRMSLLPRGAGADAGWGATLAISGLEDDYRARFGEVTPAKVIEFLALDAANPSSIFSCLRSARENAHAVRGTITSELWETQNTTWLEVRDTARHRLEGEGISAFAEWVKFRSHQSRGVTVGTMLQDEAFHFIRLGTFLERADNTSRMLDVKAHVRPNDLENPDAAADYYRWSALLRSVSAFEIYRRVYRDHITPLRVAELLVLREDMPRSLHACMNGVCDTLARVGHEASRETERRAGKLRAELHYARIEDIVAAGLHEFLVEFQDRVADLGSRIATDFLIPPTIQ